MMTLDKGVKKPLRARITIPIDTTAMVIDRRMWGERRFIGLDEQESQTDCWRFAR
jgi:hypothetical protein